VLLRPYAERDVENVESYIRETVRNIWPDIVPDEREQVIARGVMLVSRIAQALPPETSLAALLDEQLGNWIAVCRWRGARRRAEHARVAPRPVA
jgi:hypothetical protein